jgi:hypothetical protein
MTVKQIAATTALAVAAGIAQYYFVATLWIPAFSG